MSSLLLALQFVDPGCFLMPAGPTGRVVLKNSSGQYLVFFAEYLLVGRLCSCPRLKFCNAHSCKLKCGYCSTVCTVELFAAFVLS
ncbi:hypothetical protein Nepgr_009314 [Nepenthes gracilis]|uniref:Secreted protein n=1 Tax=Nepenthes gracilis TaxID=150966 RepID=A0AAD3SB33_NEPGR|nr:hypothetical protein Nepgr_009314 [Nepenthes gracilis]